MVNGDGRPATLGDIKELYGQIDKRHERSEEKFEKAIKDKIALHSAQCKANDYYKVQKEVYQGKLPPFVENHPLITLGGGGTGIGLLISGLLKVFGG